MLAHGGRRHKGGAGMVVRERITASWLETQGKLPHLTVFKCETISQEKIGSENRHYNRRFAHSS